MSHSPRPWTLLLALVLAGCTTPGQRPLNPPREDVSVKPGINKDFLAPDVDLGRWTETFEGESREIAASKDAIVAALDLARGEEVVDVGAGTGLFTFPMARAVGVSGKVYALDIAPRFVEHVAAQAREQGLEQVVPRLSGERSLGLPRFSVDAAFVCDTYHHFEYPQSMLYSIYDALRPLGRLYVVDFDRLPGISREWILTHVRADKTTVRREIEKAGFEFVEEITVPGFDENYLLVFRRP
jgi:ubiquinone/menaquinone biosynthesis C-methylase UbiE